MGKLCNSRCSSRKEAQRERKKQKAARRLRPPPASWRDCEDIYRPLFSLALRTGTPTVCKATKNCAGQDCLYGLRRRVSQRVVVGSGEPRKDLLLRSRQADCKAQI